MFVKEAQFKKNLYGSQKILEMRNEPEYIEIIDSIFKILKDTDPTKGSALENAFKYILDREGGFRSFLSDGHIELSNNISERAIKPFVFARKNFLFSNTENGAESSLIYFSIQQTEKNISLIDGDTLTSLMIQNEVGVRSVQTYAVYEIDTNFLSLY